MVIGMIFPIKESIYINHIVIQRKKDMDGINICLDFIRQLFMYVANEACSFTYLFFEFHQFKMEKEDNQNTSFIIEWIFFLTML